MTLALLVEVLAVISAHSALGYRVGGQGDSSCSHSLDLSCLPSLNQMHLPCLFLYLTTHCPGTAR